MTLIKVLSQIKHSRESLTVLSKQLSKTIHNLKNEGDFDDVVDYLYDANIRVNEAKVILHQAFIDMKMNLEDMA